MSHILVVHVNEFRVVLKSFYFITNLFLNLTQPSQGPLYNREMVKFRKSYFSCRLHNSFARSHLSPIAVGVAKSLVGAKVVEAVHELRDNANPRHVLVQVLLLVRDGEQAVLRHVLLVRGCA